MTRYELLNQGDVIKDGDEYWDTRYMRWVRSIESIGRGVGTYDVFRRHITDKPKVRLHELSKIIYEVCVESEPNWPDLCAKEICTRLGIEIEEDKEEWEGAYQNWKARQRTIVQEPLLKDAAKAMFEAGQQSERGKGEK